MVMVRQEVGLFNPQVIKWTKSPMSIEDTIAEWSLRLVTENILVVAQTIIKPQTASVSSYHIKTRPPAKIHDGECR